MKKLVSINLYLYQFYHNLFIQESGISMNGISTPIFGTLALLSADNPASSSCGGFKESGSAYRYCRQCLANTDEAKSTVSAV